MDVTRIKLQYQTVLWLRKYNNCFTTIFRIPHRITRSILLNKDTWMKQSLETIMGLNKDSFFFNQVWWNVVNLLRASTSAVLKSCTDLQVSQQQNIQIKAEKGNRLLGNNSYRQEYTIHWTSVGFLNTCTFVLPKTNVDDVKIVVKFT